MIMKLTVTNENDVGVIEVTETMAMEAVARKIQEALSIPVSEQQIFYKNEPITLQGNVGSKGIEDDDILVISRIQNQPAAAVPTAGTTAPAAGAVPMQTSGDMGMGMDADAQRQIEDRIRQENVMQNMAQALEHNPEAFGSVVMLFVDCKVNGVATKAFVDSGAQTTIISKECAERCSILRLLDKRFAGVARGVGSAPIHGRIHLSLLTLDNQVFECTFTVMDSVGGGYDLLLGLDMLKKHRASIDLNENVLKFGGATVPFLPEKDIPMAMRSNALPENNQQQQQAPANASGTTPQPNNSNSQAAISAAISGLVAMGFTREEAMQALRATGGNADQAAAMLTQAKYGF